MSRTVLLKDAMELVTDYVANGSFAALKQNVHYKSTRSYAMLLRLVDHNANYKNDRAWVDEGSYRFLRKSSVKPGDIIIANVGANAGKVFRAPDLGVPMTLGPNAVLLRSKKSNDYFYYWLISQEGQAALKSILSGSAQPKFNKTDLRALPVPDPDLRAQESVAYILKTIDEKIELNRRINETLEQICKTLYAEQLVNNPETQNWAEKSLLGVGTLAGGGTPKTSEPSYWGGDIAWFSVVDAPSGSDLFVVSTAKSITLEGLEHSAAKLIPKYATIISARGTVGKLAVAAREMTINQSCYALISDTPFFLYLLLNSQVDVIKSRVHGSVFDTITRETLEKVRMPLPPRRAIVEFDKAVTPFFERILSNVLEIDRLGQIRDSLLPKLLSGELRI